MCFLVNISFIIFSLDLNTQAMRSGWSCRVWPGSSASYISWQFGLQDVRLDVCRRDFCNVHVGLLKEV
jgi:hypothetical protein